MIPLSSRCESSSSRQSWSLLALIAVIACALTGCATTQTSSSGTYHTDAYAASSPSDVKVKVSLRAEMVYVMEGDRALLVTPCTIGTADHATPTGSFHVTAKNPTKRSGEYGFWVNGSNAVPGAVGASPGPGYSYVGYPMAYWVEFAPGFGFHEGYVWPIPRSHGCLRLHPNAAEKFYELAQIGTPVEIAVSQPEDATIGRNVLHPSDYKDPDPPASEMISPDFFNKPRDKDLLPAGTAPVVTAKN